MPRSGSPGASPDQPKSADVSQIGTNNAIHSTPTPASRQAINARFLALHPSNLFLTRPSTRGIGARHEENGKKIEEKHQGKICFGPAVGALEFLPNEDAPQGRDHRRGLAHPLRDRHPPKIPRYKV